MKRILLPLAAALSILSACDTKNEIMPETPATGQTETEETSLMPVSLSIERPYTKSLEASSAESSINSLQVVIYSLDAEGNKTYESLYSFGAASKDYVIYIDPDRTDVDKYIFAAYINHPAMSETTYAQDWSLLQNERLTGFQMYGQAEYEYDETESDPTVHITAVRQCSRVEIHQIGVDWTNSLHSNKEFKLKGIYLMDVPGVFQNLNELDDNIIKSDEIWYNRNGHPFAAQDDLLYDEIKNIAVKEGTPYNKTHYLYGYISDLTTYNTTSEWIPGGTRLVIEAEFDGAPCYYAIKLNGLNNGEKLTDIRNKKFIFNKITITKPGSAQPYEELPEESPVNLSVNIQEWQTGFSGDYTVQ